MADGQDHWNTPGWKRATEDYHRGRPRDNSRWNIPPMENPDLQKTNGQDSSADDSPPGGEQRAALIAAARPLTFCSDFGNSVALDFIIKGIFARGHTSHLFGPPGSGKSALLGSAAVCLGSQPSWYGFKIKQKLATVFFPFERADLIKKRIWAQCQRDGIDIDNVPIAVAEPLNDLMSQPCINQIIGTILAAEDKLGLEIGLCGFDTVNKGIARGGGDEDKAKDQNRAWGNLRRVHEGMARYHPVHLAGIGHTGKDESRGARGSNAQKGDNDIELQVRNGPIKAVEISKANEMPEGPLMRFCMEPYDTSVKDDEGDPVQVWIPAAEKITAVAAAEKVLKLTKNQQTIFNLLLDAGAAGLTLDEWNDKAREADIGVRRRADLIDIRMTLKDHKMVHEYGGRWYVNHKS
jgi:hypothetical protein